MYVFLPLENRIEFFSINNNIYFDLIVQYMLFCHNLENKIIKLH